MQQEALDQVIAQLQQHKDAWAGLGVGARIDYLRGSTPQQPLQARVECYKLTRQVAFVRGVAYNLDIEDPVASMAHVEQKLFRLERTVVIDDGLEDIRTLDRVLQALIAQKPSEHRTQRHQVATAQTRSGSAHH